MKAILQKGAIVPLEPLPPEWEEGITLEVDRANGAAPDVDAWAEQMQRLCADSLPEEEARMQAALDEQHRQAKAQTCPEPASSSRDALVYFARPG